MKYKVFDIEARDWNKVYAIGIYDGANVKTFYGYDYSVKDFVKWLFDNLSDGDVVYAHNGGKYDFLFLIEGINKYKLGKILDIKIIHGGIVSLLVEYKKKKLLFKDTFFILPASLKSLTEDYNVKHKKLELNYELGLNDKRFFDYFANDLMGLYEVISEVPELTAKDTIASNSMKAFSDIYVKKYGKMVANNYKKDNFFRYGYYGGRVEVFKLFGRNLYYYDFNSLYPYVMQKYSYPLLIPDNFEYSNDFNELGYYYCKIKSPNNLLIPVLPYRREDGRLLFPLGEWKGYYYTPELQKAKEMGYEISVIKGVRFIKTAPIFKEFVEHYYKIKKQSAGSKRWVAKIFLNSLYGKFGQHREYTDYSLVKINSLKEGELRKFVNGDYALNSKTKYVVNGFMHTEVAGLITSYARLELYKMMQKAGFENVYYADTDSIITSKELPVGEELGEVKLEHFVNEYIGLSAKLYAIREGDKVIIKAKGYNVKNLSFNSFVNALHGNYSEFKSEINRLIHIKEFYIHHKSSYIDKITIKHNFKKIYDKRIVNTDGTTLPILLN
ncbi:MAG: DNA polymerase [Candidatus Aenigmatarchaeota archaeon]